MRKAQDQEAQEKAARLAKEREEENLLAWGRAQTMAEDLAEERRYERLMTAERRYAESKRLANRCGICGARLVSDPAFNELHMQRAHKLTA